MKQSVTDLVDALASILPMPEDESPEMTIARLRQWSAYMLGRQGNPIDVQLLITVLTDPQPKVREQALVALGMIGDITSRSDGAATE